MNHYNAVTFISLRTSCVTDYVIDNSDICEVIFLKPVLHWLSYTAIKPLQNFLNSLNTIATSNDKLRWILPDLVSILRPHFTKISDYFA